MTDVSDGKRDFFISFTGADRPWARWLARVLHEEGYTSCWQDQDFAGSISRSIEAAHTATKRTILLLSDAYAKSGYCRSEWDMRWQDDTGGEQDLLVLFRLGPCEPPPLLKRLAYEDLFACPAEEAARELVRHRLCKAADPTYRRPLGDAPFPPREAAPFPIPPHNLAPANPDFIGREDALAQLHKTLSRNGAAVITQAHAITGLGGVGKSQAALAYCYRHLADHRLIWWLRAEEPATLAADYAGLADPLGLPELPEQEKQIQAVKRQLQASRGWLLVLDNAEDPAAVRPYLPGTGGQVLVTSRRADWRGLASTLPLDVLPEAEAVALLLGGLAADPAQQEAAAVLAAELGHLPLALAQARAFVQARKVSIATYRQQLAAARPKVFAWRPADAAYPLAVAQTWQASIDAAAQDCPAARPLLELLAFLAPEAVPRDLLGADPEALPESLRDAFERDGAIEALARFSLLRAETDSVAVHRLVQAVTRDGLDEATAEARAAAVVSLLANAMPFYADYPSTWATMQALLPHALVATEIAERLNVALEATASILGQMAVYHHRRAAWPLAEVLLKRAIAINEQTFRPEHPDLPVRLNGLGALYQATGRYAEAEPLLKRAIALEEDIRR